MNQVIKHSYIITGSGAYDKALEIARRATGSEKLECPDIISIFRAKTELTVDQVRDVVSDSIVLPNESAYKVYIFADAEYMNIPAQNAALKLLEEPPSHVILILCASKPEVFLPTVRSRCIEINLTSEANTEYELSEEFLDAFSSGIVSRIRWLEEHSKMSISECKDFCVGTCNLIADIVCKRHGNYDIKSDTLMRLEKELEKCIKYLDANVNVKQIIGLLEIFDD